MPIVHAKCFLLGSGLSTGALGGHAIKKAIIMDLLTQ